ncbi:hypothetical protein GCM10012287_15440 [Streptomyces daqingensis]|uniref:Uncharacterized protein n=1 Tax=Streptomyces daqingensis TaxID=1472640 RepID=A0ABQ2M2E2_9ACTN|nr:hypothetical protein [Streptomyces daqingensis]GGO46048.1 hypothetical protein GCM10012287_15440 [Streptomyces daqingensis]
MTAQSGRGQGDQPLYEGVVLPANGDPWTPEQQRQVAQSQVQPPAGQPWGQPWGPESQAAASQAAVAAGENSAALPPPPAHAPPEPPSPPMPAQSPQMPGGQAPSMPVPEAPPMPAAQAPPMPPEQPPLAQPGPLPVPGGQSPGPMPQPDVPDALPQVQQYGPDAAATQLVPPVHDAPAQPYAAAVQPPHAPAGVGDADATQYIPPVPDVQSGHLPPGHLPPAGPADATQMLPPQTGQAPRDPEATTMLRSPLPPETGGAAGPQGAGAYAAAPGAGAQQQRTTPAEFDSLFRSDTPGPSGGDGEPGSTQSLPIFDRAATRQRSGGPGPTAVPGGPGAPAGPPAAAGRAARRNAERGPASRLTSPVALIAAGVVIVAAVGMAAGAALSGGGEKEARSGAPSGQDEQKADEKKAPAAPDPAEAQARELDKLLADSNNSRATVVTSVENIKSCKKLGKAADDLRAAAGQRNGLVARLGKLKTDELPASGELTAALTRAWKSSAAADNHYAAWADQTAGKKGCRKGKARVTAHTGAGTRASGQATAAKKKAAGLWNPTAKKYGLKERQFGQL